jgi:hypothetical protein
LSEFHSTIGLEEYWRALSQIAWVARPRRWARNASCSSESSSLIINGAAMTTPDIDLQQRIEEIQLALAGLFETPKAPASSSYDDGRTLYLQLSWVVESTRDTTLDSRCVATLRLPREQIERYAALDTSKRLIVQDRLKTQVRQRFDEQQNPPAVDGACSVEIAVDDSLFDVRDDPY